VEQVPNKKALATRAGTHRYGARAHLHGRHQPGLELVAEGVVKGTLVGLCQAVISDDTR